VPSAFPGQAAGLVDAVGQMEIEGVVLKRLDLPCWPGQRTGDWLKIRNEHYSRKNSQLR